ncbi:unnamed protein product [Mytilus edulis]|uniref:Uncharacterized protein n=1 Tax=Mytilus edulis TaxID=6550 RepID=A0A8S3RVR8_MYTED|nr:unnamed protein product [Mytilus edulis]
MEKVSTVNTVNDRIGDESGGKILESLKEADSWDSFLKICQSTDVKKLINLPMTPMSFNDISGIDKHKRYAKISSIPSLLQILFMAGALGRPIQQYSEIKRYGYDICLPPCPCQEGDSPQTLNVFWVKFKATSVQMNHVVPLLKVREETGIVIVICPLTSIMQDQVKTLKKGIRTSFVNLQGAVAYSYSSDNKDSDESKHESLSIANKNLKLM